VQSNYVKMPNEMYKQTMSTCLVRSRNKDWQRWWVMHFGYCN